MSHTKVKKISKHFLVKITLFFENYAIYEIMWRNMVKPDRPQKTI
jgi:inorganic pyrophosphatase